MASSRIFVKGLPPTFTDGEFKKHFSQKQAITDAKIFPQRRIGYVGYKTPEDALKAVKYFNKTFIRISRIGVEIARPIDDLKPSRSVPAPTAQLSSGFEGNRVGEKHPLKRKRGSPGKEDEDPKLKEFLEAMKPPSKTKSWQNVGEGLVDQVTDAGNAPAAGQDGASDSEYDEVPKKQKLAEPSQDDGRDTHARVHDEDRARPVSNPPPELFEIQDAVEADAPSQSVEMVASDADWLRSKTSRLLGLLDDEEEAAGADRADQSEESDDDVQEAPHPAHGQAVDDFAASELSAEPAEMPEAPGPYEPANEAAEAVRSSMRLFLRNLSYDVTREDLEAEFAPFGALSEVHVPVDFKTGQPKGFAYIHFDDPDSAEKAFLESDGKVFQGRLLHVLPATAKREEKLDDFALSKLPLKKQQQIKRRREAASSTFNWNALYLNADAVVSSVADRLGLAKSEVLDPTSSDAAVRQAHAETHIIQETKGFFKSQGVDLDAFKKSQRGDTAILLKNIPYDASTDELKRLFEEHGTVTRFVIPPSATLAIVEFATAPQAKAAFRALAYRKIKNSVLFLEKAPKNLFTKMPQTGGSAATGDGVTRVSTSDLLQKDAPGGTHASSTVFVRNLNFTTDSGRLTEGFKPLEGFLSARVKTRTDPRKPGRVLSMGFGFLEFRSKANAASALAAMDGHVLDGHKLQLRASHKGADAAEERRIEDTSKKEAGRKTKIIIKNLPFEASKKDVWALFGAYGMLRSVRVPKKMDRGARGFAFADFATPKEAESAIDALRDTHLLGRRLVLDFAAADPEDAEAEIKKMQEKVGSQVNQVALQKLTSGGRKKFTTSNDEMDEG